MTGTSAALLRGEVDMTIANHDPAGFLGEQLIQLRFIPVTPPAIRHISLAVF